MMSQIIQINLVAGIKFCDITYSYIGLDIKINQIKMQESETHNHDVEVLTQGKASLMHLLEVIKKTLQRCLQP